MAYCYYRTLTMAVATAPYLRQPVTLKISAAPAMSVMGLMPVTLTIGVPAAISFVQPHGAETLRMGAATAMSMTITVPTDTRTSYTSLVDDIDTHVLEVTPRVRTTERRNEEFGTVTYHTRLFTCPAGKSRQAALNSILALGAHMNSRWTDEYHSLGIDGPKVSSVSVQRHAQTAQDAIQVTFAEINLPAPVVTGYNETLRIRPAAQEVFGDVAVTWGITNSRWATNVPARGDKLDRHQGRAAYRCQRVEFFDDRLPGRILVRATWLRRLRDDTPVEASDVS